MPQCDETRFSTLQPSIDITGIRNDDGSEEKMMPLFWLHQLHAPSFGVNWPKQTKAIERQLNFFF